jgi:hypothetical protein
MENNWPRNSAVKEMRAVHILTGLLLNWPEKTRADMGTLLNQMEMAAPPCLRDNLEKTVFL